MEHNLVLNALCINVAYAVCLLSVRYREAGGNTKVAG